MCPRIFWKMYLEPRCCLCEEIMWSLWVRFEKRNNQMKLSFLLVYSTRASKSVSGSIYPVAQDRTSGAILPLSHTSQGFNYCALSMPLSTLESLYFSSMPLREFRSLASLPWTMAIAYWLCFCLQWWSLGPNPCRITVSFISFVLLPTWK